MIYISVQPDIPYFHWQIEVMLTNFKEVGIDLSKCHVIFLHKEKESEQVRGLKNKYDAQFFSYLDDREDKCYIPSIKPYGMYKHFSSIEIDQCFFYHDSDIIFKKKVELIPEENQCVMSDTISYIGYDYCVSKGEEQLSEMAEIVGVDIETIKSHQSSSGGAQYIYYSTPKEYWLKVYNDSNKLYQHLDERSKTDIPKQGDYLIQKWCAEMWATLWNMWLFRIDTKVSKELNFVFATAPISEYEKCNILHNAGVTDKNKHNMFFKGAFIHNSPFEQDLSYVDPSYCSFFYTQAVKQVAREKNKVEFYESN